MEFPYTLKEASVKLGGHVSGDEVLCPGPNHSAKDRSLAVKPTTGNGGFVVYSHSGDDPIVCRDYVCEKLGLPKFTPSAPKAVSDDVISRAVMMAHKANHKPKSKPVAVYPYTDVDGKVLYEKLRFEPKRFAYRLPDGTYKGPERRVVYRWPELIKYPDATVFVCEGEKDANNVAALDLCATTVASGKWTDSCVQALADRECWILQDNDDAGREKALEAARLLHPAAKSVKIIALPGLPDRGDVSDWLDAGHTKDELEDVCCKAPDWQPETDQSTVTSVTVEPEADRSTVTDVPVKSQTAEAPLCFVKIENWLEHDPPRRDWAVPNRFPLRNVSLLSGEGSIGKTIVLMQLAAAHVLGRGWLDTLPESGDAIYLNAEDEQDEMHRRFVDIARLYDASLAEFKDHLHVLAMAGQDAVLAHVNRHGLVKPTPLFDRLLEAAGDIKPKFIGLDTSADVFSGNESDRVQVRQFIGLLRRIAIVSNSGVIVCAHPSLTGISSGTGLSGSTAWHNSVRARAYLHSIKVDDTEPDKELRQLDFMKSNYSAIADSVTLRWKDGVFIPEAKPGSLEKMAADAKADEAFLTLLAKFTRQGRNVSDKATARNYAPTEFARDNTDFKKMHYADAMRRLFNADRIRVETYGRWNYGRIVAC
jgi:RecA-family ATPase